MTSKEQRIIMWSSAIILGGGAIYFNYHNLRDKFWSRKTSTILNEKGEGVDSVDDQMSDDESVTLRAYEYKGLDTLGDYEIVDISVIRLKELKNIYISETTPDGDVIMNYNYETENFEYFSDNTIAYKYLETVARLYVMENNCCSIFIILWDELVAGWRKMKGLDASGSEIEEDVEEVDGPFATLKNYKKEERNQMVIVDKSNTYKFVEKLAVYDELIFRKNQGGGPYCNEDGCLLTFADWKALQQKSNVGGVNDAEKLKDE